MFIAAYEREQHALEKMSCCQREKVALTRVFLRVDKEGGALRLPQYS